MIHVHMILDFSFSISFFMFFFLFWLFLIDFLICLSRNNCKIPCLLFVVVTGKSTSLWKFSNYSSESNVNSREEMKEMIVFVVLTLVYIPPQLSLRTMNFDGSRKEANSAASFLQRHRSVSSDLVICVLNINYLG